ncbi:alpha/beta hydrolase [Pelistega ratti]|uniref:alpha/beta hydrolase n=1 Tax=Pelistega ratti TaxID=2652177 RepID=UPI00135B050F|nr:alpha/beta hydrolase [Pelistega ratti]
MHTDTVFFSGHIGQIECAIDYPDSPPRGWALCLHPHPLFKGTNTNKVITTLSRACVAHGLVTLRPNFRGVGQSAGEFDKAHGETLDMVALIQQFLAQHPEFSHQPWILGGFSFGTAVAAQLYAELQDHAITLPQKLILMGVGVWRYAYREVKLPEDVFIVHGEKDDVIPLVDAYEWLKDREVPITVIPNATHFFHGKLVILKHLLQQQLRLAI